MKLEICHVRLPVAGGHVSCKSRASGFRRNDENALPVASENTPIRRGDAGMVNEYPQIPLSLRSRRGWRYLLY